MTDTLSQSLAGLKAFPAFEARKNTNGRLSVLAQMNGMDLPAFLDRINLIPSGTGVCQGDDCTKTVSGNKRLCFACLQKEAARTETALEELDIAQRAAIGRIAMDQIKETDTADPIIPVPRAIRKNRRLAQIEAAVKLQLAQSSTPVTVVVLGADDDHDLARAEGEGMVERAA